VAREPHPRRVVLHGDLEPLWRHGHGRRAHLHDRDLDFSGGKIGVIFAVGGLGAVVGSSSRQRSRSRSESVTQSSQESSSRDLERSSSQLADGSLAPLLIAVGVGIEGGGGSPTTSTR